MMRARAAVSTLVFILMHAAAPVLALAFQPPAGQDQFVPAKNLPPSETIPAGPLLVAAYAFIWVAVAFYRVDDWRRLNRVEIEMRALANKSDRR